MKRIITYIISTLTLLVTWAIVVFWGTIEGLWHKPITEESNVESFVTATDDKVNSELVGNMAMAVIEGGELKEDYYFSSGKQVNENSVFQVASLSKWVSAMGIMKLVEDGKLDLDAPVSAYLTRWQLPPSQFDNGGVTIRRLLSHTAGLTDGLGYSGFEDGVVPQTLEQSLTKASDADEGVSGKVAVGIEPGSEFLYSGGGYTLLQLLVEEVTGLSFVDYMQSAVFEPLGLKHVTYDWKQIEDGALVDFYDSDGTLAKHYRYTSLAATSLYVSLADLVTLAQFHLEVEKGTGRTNILKQETLQLMRHSHATSLGADIWGLGTILYAPLDNGDFIFGHDGKSTPPINTALRLNPETGDGIVILETGHSDLATTLASEWVYWTTGEIDNLLFAMKVDTVIMMIIFGWAVIVLGAVLTAYSGKKKSRRNKLRVID
ncbi:MAG: serine hydrolase domain-containing protein [Bacteroidota bacterium]